MNTLLLVALGAKVKMDLVSRLCIAIRAVCRPKGALSFQLAASNHFATAQLLK